MDWQITAYVVALMFATLVSLGAAAMALRYTDRPGGTALGLVLLSVAQWCGAYIIEANAITIPHKVFWSQVAYLGTQAAGPLLFTFAVRLTHRDHLLRPTILALVWSVPIITVALAFTNGAHGLVWSGFTFVDPTHHILIYERGPWFWVMAAHAYVLLTTTSAFLIGTAARMRHVYRPQSLTILGAVSVPWAINVVYLIMPSLLKHRDWTPVGFAATGLLLTWAFWDLQLLDLMPVARDLVVEHMQEGVLVLDAVGRVVDVNAAAQWLIGGTYIVGRRAASLFGELSGVIMGPSLGAPLDDGSSFAMPKDVPPRGELVTIQGKTLEWTIAPLYRDSERLVGHIVLLRDVTDQRVAEKALQEVNTTLEAQVDARTAEIQAAQQRSEAILRTVNDGIMMVDQDLTIKYTNPAFTTITGYDYDQAVGTNLANDFGGEVRDRLMETREAGRSWQGELRVPHADGRLIDLAVSIVPIYDEAGRAAGFVCTGQDIGRLTDLVRTRKGILDNISHQLRTPVTTLRLYAHLLGQTELSDAQRRTVSVIDDQTAWLQHIIEDILEMTSLEGGTAVGSWQTVPVADLLALTWDRYVSRITEAGLEIHMPDLAAKQLSVKGDSGRLMQALGEIVSNAILFTPDGGRIVFAVSEGEIDMRRAIAISITDSGPGIPVDEQPRVFERFYRGYLAESRQIPGTGLGLSIAETIIRAHGGYIELESGDGGSTFRIWLPAA